MTRTGAWIGVDICKCFLDVYIPGKPPLRFANDADGRRALAELLRALGMRGVVLEATGGLEREVLAALIAAEVPASIVNPARVRAFAEGTGQLAKTDRIDAKVLAAYGAYMQPPPSALPSGARAKLKELIGYRAQIGAEITARS
jgi:transposase